MYDEATMGGEQQEYGQQEAGWGEADDDQQGGGYVHLPDIEDNAQPGSGEAGDVYYPEHQDYSSNELTPAPDEEAGTQTYTPVPAEAEQPGQRPRPILEFEIG